MSSSARTRGSFAPWICGWLRTSIMLAGAQVRDSIMLAMPVTGWLELQSMTPIVTPVKAH